jgi:hypothetical protein
MAAFVSKFGNPWAFETWNVTNQGQFLNLYGPAKAAEFAATAGSINGARPPDPRRIKRDVYIINKKIGVSGSSGGGTGSSGSGPPP